MNFHALPTFQLTQSLRELSNAKEEASQQLLKEIEVVKELQTVNESLSKQSKNSDEHLSVLEQELKALQDTIAMLRECVETKDSELKVRIGLAGIPLSGYIYRRKMQILSRLM